MLGRLAKSPPDTVPGKLALGSPRRRGPRAHISSETVSFKGKNSRRGGTTAGKRLPRVCEANQNVWVPVGRSSVLHAVRNSEIAALEDFAVEQLKIDLFFSSRERGECLSRAAPGECSGRLRQSDQPQKDFLPIHRPQRRQCLCLLPSLVS